MEFFKRVTEALVLESDEDEDEDDEEVVRGEDATRNGGAATGESDNNDDDDGDDDTDEIKALMSSAFSFTRGALATIKQATHEVSNELKES